VSHNCGIAVQAQKFRIVQLDGFLKDQSFYVEASAFLKTNPKLLTGFGIIVAL
jgi:hypothetical protein